jgi:CDP-diacylglycerol--glycerol-3-phosphate 3-phosphatidyltransferase
METKSSRMEKTANDPSAKKTFTDYLRLWFKWVLDPLGRFFNRMGLTPNMMTILGMMGNTIGAYYLAHGEMVTGGLFVLLMTPIDALDGTMARLRGEASDWGAFVDSVSDRYSELIIYGGLLYYFISVGETTGGMLTFGAAAGSVLVSYVKARAEGLGFGAKVGLLTRVERYLVLAPSLLFNKVYFGLALIAVLANVTALQRIWFVRRQAHERLRAKAKGNS